MAVRRDLEHERATLLSSVAPGSPSAQALAVFNAAQRIVPPPAPVVSVSGVRYSTSS